MKDRCNKARWFGMRGDFMEVCKAKTTFRFKVTMWRQESAEETEERAKLAMVL